MANVKYLGTKKVYDENGVELELDLIQKKYDAMDKKGWRRAILGDLMEVIEQVGNKKIAVMSFLIENMNGKNEIDLTQDEVVEKTGISKPTVNETFKALVKANLLKKIKRKYVLNTQIISIYGAADKNRNLCIQYEFNQGSTVQKTEEERIEEEKLRYKQLLKTKEETEKELEYLRYKYSSSTAKEIIMNSYEVVGNKILIKVNYKDKTSLKELFKTARYDVSNKVWTINNNVRNEKKLQEFLNTQKIAS